MESEARTLVTLRSLAASLATAALMLGAAVVAVPAGAVAADDQAIFELNVNEEFHFQPGGTFSVGVSIWREGDLVPAPDPGSQIAVKVTFPEQLEFQGGSCVGFVSPGDVAHFPPDQGESDSDYTFESGDECIVEGGLGTSRHVQVYLDFSYRAAAFFHDDPNSDAVPPPGIIGLAIENTYVMDRDSELAVGREVEGPPAEATSTVVFDAPYRASVTPADPVTWPNAEFIEVDYLLSAPQLGAPESVVDFTSAATTWDLRWPDFATPVTEDAASDFASCDPAFVDQGFCRVTFLQQAPVILNAVPEPPDGPALLAVPNEFDVPIATSCGAGYCNYLLVLRFRPPAALEGSAVAGNFTMDPVGGWYLPPAPVPVPVPVPVPDPVPDPVPQAAPVPVPAPAPVPDPGTGTGS